MALGCAAALHAAEPTPVSTLTLITPGNPATTYQLSGQEGQLTASPDVTKGNNRCPSP